MNSSKPMALLNPWVRRERASEERSEAVCCAKGQCDGEQRIAALTRMEGDMEVMLL